MSSKGQVTIDIEEGFNLLKERLTEIKAQFPIDLDYTNWRKLSAGDKLKLVSRAVNHIVSNEEACKMYLVNDKKLNALAAIAGSHKDIYTVSLDIVFWQHVGAALRKIKYPVTNIRQKENQIKQLIHRSIESEEVVDVFKMAGIEKFDISIVNDDFLASAKGQKSGMEIKIELLRQIINNEIKLRHHKKIIKYKKLKEEVEKVINQYHNHFFDSLIVLQKLCDTARKMQEEDERRKTFGLSEEEEAFYDILHRHPSAVNDNELIKEIVKEETATIKKNLQIDWYKKPDAKAQLILSVRRVLSRKGVEAELKEILDEIMEQAEVRYM